MAASVTLLGYRLCWCWCWPRCWVGVAATGAGLFVVAWLPGLCALVVAWLPSLALGASF